ncbi:putative glycosidase [Yersinia ruckeri ATCC 29473]|uniref:Uncharacterized protein n=2 Tax=Yersinia ruckeri TaxID=29486 RepID=A0A380QR21_YERRU|nr:hypothetical protein QMA0440_00321 [Yersinia ruckeri]EEP99511.1 Glycosidase [Yersinia ruckeri ATCC 29473]KFE40357.1 Glycosidase [Yersinia ruckeri]KGA43746.1 putative glycosidase [Yersinia ruckeri ATCC 29473]QTD78072.1 Uncharacterized protein YR821_3156 [Yersinia ruckeri]
MLPARAISYPPCYRLQPISFRDGNGDGMGNSSIEALINLQPYTQTATPSEATLLLAWRHGAQRESHQSAGSHQWVIPGFASAIFLQSGSHEKAVCASKGVMHG